jgi:hypothetical protein
MSSVVVFPQAQLLGFYTVRTAGDNPRHTSLTANQVHAIKSLPESNFLSSYQ